MQSDSFSVYFFLRKGLSDKKKWKIYCRVLVDRIKSDFSTSCVIEPSKWDNSSGKVKGNNGVNDELVDIESKIRSTRRRLIDNDILFDAKAIVEYYKGNKSTKVYILEFFQNKIDRLFSEAGEKQTANRKNYITAFGHIKAFLQNSYNRNDMLIQNIDLEILQDLDHYLMNVYVMYDEKHMCRNSANKIHARLKAVLHDAISKEIININPYSKGFKLKHEKTHREFLTLKEVDDVRKLDFSNNKRLNMIRDFFLFSVYTGLRFSDAANLTMNEVFEEESGDGYIQLIMGKTKEPVTIPILPVTKKIIEKYKNDPAREIKGLVLPKYSNQKINKGLHEIMKKLEINKKITHHNARHTFASIALNNGIPLEIVQKLCGHTDIKTTGIYAKIQHQYLHDSFTDKMRDIF